MNQPWDPEANAIFARAIGIDSLPDRAAYLERTCAGDQQLRQRVDRLLAAHHDAGSFLQHDQEWAEDVGAQIGPYKLLQEIGEGGFGVVYMAEQTQPINRMVALKIIKPGMDTREVIARFEAERQALAIMDHPNIARVFDGGATETGRPYFVMELVKGIPVTDFCDQSTFSTRERLRLFAIVCRAVKHAHQKGVVHRDLKPSNVMVTLHDGEPVPKVIDFGVSKATSQKLTEKTMFTAYGQMIGTPQYMSPEQAEMSGLDIDTRSDVYSLGVLLYELLTGTTPLEAQRLRGQMFAELQRLIREEEAARPSMRVSTLGNATAAVAAKRGTDGKKLGALLRGELDWIVMKALEKNRSRRYETANGFAADVQRYLNDEPVVACPPTARYRLRKLARRHKTAIATTAVVAIALIVGTIVSSWQAIRAASAQATATANATFAQKKADDAAREANRATKSEEELRDLQQELQERLYSSDMQLASQAYAVGDIKHMNDLLERHRATANAEQPLGFEWRHLWRAGHSYEAWIRQPLAIFRKMAVSPDGKTLAVLGPPGRVYVYDMATKRLLCSPLTVDHEWDIPCFSPDGSHLVVAGGSALRRTYVFGTDDWARVATLETDGVRGVAFGPVQDELLMATGGPGKITFWNTSSWKPEDELPIRGSINHLAFAPDGTKIVASLKDSNIEIWDVHKKEVTRRLNARGGAIAASRDGNLLAIKVGPDVRIWNSADFFAETGDRSPIQPPLI